jgi:Uroporphyrinogen decarboxylase (URO-D)
LGAESIKCGVSWEHLGSLKIPDEYFADKKKLPDDVFRIGPLGIIHKRAHNQEEGYHWWYVDGYLTTPDRFDQWRSHIKNIKPPKQENLVAFNEFLPIAYEKGICPFVPGGGPFTYVIEAMGLKAYSRAMRKNPEFVKEILNLFTDVICEQLKAVADNTNARLFLIADDVAMKYNVILAPKVMEEFYLDSYKRIVESIGNNYIYFHSDGFVEPLLPYMIEAGFHGVQCLEEIAGVDIRRVKKQYGQDICLIGNMDVSRDLYFATPQEIAQKSQKLVEDLGPEGYIFGPCSTIYAGHPLENIQAMVTGWKKGNKKHSNIPL